jgi:cytochrome b subunit of formate dehydrogenase
VGTATEVERSRVERYTRPVRWFHAAIYLTVLVLLGTGWWLFLGREGDPSPLSRLTGQPDTRLHRWVGWALAGLVVAGPLAGVRAAATFVRESLRHSSGDLRWLTSWPKATFTGRFARHEGHFDPGQRIANVVLVVLLVVLIASGIALATLHGGPAFSVLVRVHRWATWAITPVLVGHVLIAAGVLPGYRGVWRSMHLGGRLDAAVARRLWPAWVERSHQTGPRGWPRADSKDEHAVDNAPTSYDREVPDRPDVVDSRDAGRD